MRHQITALYFSNFIYIGLVILYKALIILILLSITIINFASKFNLHETIISYKKHK